MKLNCPLVAVFAELSESDFYYASKKLQPYFNIPLLNMFYYRPKANLVQTRIFPGPPDWAAGEPLAEAWLLLEHFLEQHLPQELYKKKNTTRFFLFF